MNEDKLRELVELLRSTVPSGGWSDATDYLANPPGIDLAQAIAAVPRGDESIPDAAWAVLKLEEARRLRIAELAEFEDKDYSPDRALLGALGEWVFWRAARLPASALADCWSRYSPRGDGGIDFPAYAVDIKARAHWPLPRLYLDDRWPMRAAAAVLVACDLPGRRARYLGWVTRADYEARAPTEEKHGPRRVFGANELRRGLPPRLA